MNSIYEQIQTLLKRCENDSTVMPPTILFNEGWMLRLILSSFEGLKLGVFRGICGYKNWRFRLKGNLTYSKFSPDGNAASAEIRKKHGFPQLLGKVWP